MKTTTVAGFMIMLVLAAVIMCCRNDETAPQEEVPYIPLITNSWTDVARQDHVFGFRAQRESVATGTFEGEESYTEPESTLTFRLTGSFVNRNIGFTVTRRGRDTTYSGRFIADTLIDFNGLRLFRR